MDEEALEYFTPSAKQALVLAREEAVRFRHNLVATEHILLGLLGSARGVALNVLKRRGLSLEAVRTKVGELVALGPEGVGPGHPAFTPRARKALTLAVNEAKALGHTYVGSEHMLLALLREETSVAAQVLHKLNVELKQTREDILAEHAVGGQSNLNL